MNEFESLMNPLLETPQEPHKLLCLAIAQRDLAGVAALLDRHPEACRHIDDSDQDRSWNPFLCAIHLDFDEAWALMLSRDPGLASMRFTFKRTALMSAALWGNLAAVDALLPLSNPKALDESDDSALSLAAAAGFVDNVKFLAPHSDLSQVDDCGRDPAEIALGCATYDSFQDAQFLSPYGSDLAVDGAPPPPGRSRRDRLACFRFLAPHSKRFPSQLLADGEAWASATFEFDREPLLAELLAVKPIDAPAARALLSQAIKERAIACSRLLIPLACLHEPIPGPHTPSSILHACAHAKCPEILEDLLLAAPELASLSLRGKRALAVAATVGDHRSLALLLPRGPIHALDPQGHLSALDGALLNGHRRCAQMLLQAGEDGALPLPPQALASAVASSEPDMGAWFIGAAKPAPEMLGFRFKNLHDGASPLEIALQLSRWGCAQRLLDVDPQAALAGSPKALELMARAKRMPKPLAKAIIRACSPWLFHPFAKGDAFALACQSSNPRAALRLAKKAFALPQRPAGWERQAWSDMAQAPKLSHRRWAKVAALFEPWLQEQSPQLLDELLLLACEGDPSPWPLGVEILLRAGANPNHARPSGLSACALALHRDELSRLAPACQAFATLLDAGADPLAAPGGRFETSALALACRAGWTDALRAIIPSLGAQPEALAQALALCVKRGCEDGARLLLGALPKQAPWPVNALGRCPLMLACELGQASLIPLLAPRANPAALDVLGFNALGLFLSSRAWRSEQDDIPAAVDALLSQGLGPFDALSADCKEAASRSRHWPALEAAVLRVQERQAFEECARPTQTAKTGRL